MTCVYNRCIVCQRYKHYATGGTCLRLTIVLLTCLRRTIVFGKQKHHSQNLSSPTDHVHDTWLTLIACYEKWLKHVLGLHLGGNNVNYCVFSHVCYRKLWQLKQNEADHHQVPRAAHKYWGTIQIDTGTVPPNSSIGYRNIVGAPQTFVTWAIKKTPNKE